MTTNPDIIALPTNGMTTDDHFGLCPECRQRNEVMLNIGPEHWAVCDTHRTKWCVGSNLVSGWKDEPKEMHARNWAKLTGYREVRPFYHPEGAA